MVYLVRDPLEVIPSAMSLLTGVLEKSYGMFHTTREQDRRRYLENLYQAGVYMFRSFYHAYSSGAIPRENLRLVAYPRMMRDLQATLDELLPFLEIEPPDAFRAKVKQQAERQRAHQSRHHYSLQKFGLTEKRIRQDLGFVYEMLAAADNTCEPVFAATALTK